jgi:surface protein
MVDIGFQAMTFLTYALIFVLSFGILIVLVNRNDEKKGKKKEEISLTQKNLKTNKEIGQSTEVSIPEVPEELMKDKEEKESEMELAPEIEREPVPIMESLELHSSPKEKSEHEAESVVIVEPLKFAKIEIPKTPKGSSFNEMDCVTMVLISEKTKLPLDLVVLIKSFFCSEKLTDENFKEAVKLWFENEEECKWRFGHISFWNTSQVTNMEKAFDHREDFNEDISRWDVSSVTNMQRMFYWAIQFTGDLSQWDVSRVSNMSGMFRDAARFNGNLSQWDVRSVEDLSFMFCGASQFNGDLSQWDVSKVADRENMFFGAIRYEGVRW